MDSHINRVFVISLVRRPDRRRHILHQLDLAGLGALVEVIDAVDGRELTDAHLLARGATVLPTWHQAATETYVEPLTFVQRARAELRRMTYYGRPMTTGEVGCALSHHEAWRRAAAAGYERCLIVEDDAHLAPAFAPRLQAALEALSEAGQWWHLLYVGRAEFSEFELAVVPGVVMADFSYATHAYMVSADAVAALLAAPFLESLVPVDEFLCAMYQRHPRDDVAKAFAASPRLRTLALVPKLATQGAHGSDVEPAGPSAVP